jgi:integrase/recombinase XerD
MEILIEPLLWKYNVLKNGEYAIQIRLTKYRDVKYIGTGFSSSADNWDNASNQPFPSHRKFKEIIKRINTLSEDATFEIKLAEKQGELLTMTELKNRLVKKESKIEPKKVLQFFDEIITELELAGRVGYADVFTACRATINKLFEGKDKLFAAVTEADFKRYERFINNLNSESTQSLYLRTLYRLWNIAIERKLCPEKHHPKFFIKYKAYKRVKTKKRAINSHFIQEIEKLQFDNSTRLFRSQQYCLFSYYSRGLNFSDLCKLKHIANVKNGFIYYKRSKNGRIYNFELHSKAKRIVEIFQNYPIQSNGNYVFPILHEQHNSPRKIGVRIDSALKDFNEDLRVFEEKIGCPKKITSYVIRHTFATNLRDKKVDVAIIKEALGHETELQTATYLDEIDDSIVAKKIEEALDWL